MGFRRDALRDVHGLQAYSPPKLQIWFWPHPLSSERLEKTGKTRRACARPNKQLPINRPREEDIAGGRDAAPLVRLSLNVNIQIKEDTQVNVKFFFPN